MVESRDERAAHDRVLLRSRLPVDVDDVTLARRRRRADGNRDRVAQPQPRRDQRRSRDPRALPRRRCVASQRAHRVIAAMRADGRNDLDRRLLHRVGSSLPPRPGRRRPKGSPPRSPRPRVPSSGRPPPPTITGTPTSRRPPRKARSWPVAPTSARPCSPSVSRGSGIFGPIVSPPPSGDDAVTLLDHVLAVADDVVVLRAQARPARRSAVRTTPLSRRRRQPTSM